MAKILNKYLYIDLGKAVMIVGFAAAGTSVLVYDLKTFAMSMVGTYLNGIILDNFINGFHMRKKVCIISREYQMVREYIIEDLHRGVTLYQAYGGVSREEKTEVVTVLEKKNMGSC